MEALTKPCCDSCDIKFRNMKQIDVHMKNVLGESLDLRMIRHTKAVETVHQQQISLKQTSENVKVPNSNYSKIIDFSCSECGIVFPGKEEFWKHNQDIHNHNKFMNLIEDKERKDQDDLTLEELTELHEDPMMPSREEEDWMLLLSLKYERRELANKYFVSYKEEEICDICNRYFFNKGSILEHMKIVHQQGQSVYKKQVIPQTKWLTQSLPNLEDLLSTIPSNISVTKEEELESKEDFNEIMLQVKNV